MADGDFRQMLALSAADERRALMRAAERFELCRKFGGGNCRRGAFRLAVIERRAAFAADESRGLSQDGPMERKGVSCMLINNPKGRVKQRLRRCWLPLGAAARAGGRDFARRSVGLQRLKLCQKQMGIKFRRKMAGLQLRMRMAPKREPSREKANQFRASSRSGRLAAARAT